MNTTTHASSLEMGKQQNAALQKTSCFITWPKKRKTIPGDKLDGKLWLVLNLTLN
jgi:hypothetical protein